MNTHEVKGCAILEARRLFFNQSDVIDLYGPCHEKTCLLSLPLVKTTQHRG